MSTSLIDSLDLFDGLNISPIPLEFSQEMTTTKILCAMQAKINAIITSVNSLNVKPDLDIIQTQINSILTSITDGTIVGDGSIELKKLNASLIAELEQTIMQYVLDNSKFMWFGLNDAGYYYVVMPENLRDVTFETDVEGRLILEY